MLLCSPFKIPFLQCFILSVLPLSAPEGDFPQFQQSCAGYGVLHTPSYREKYKEFLKIDFPRIPFPENKEEFERIVSIGNKLRKLHLMEEIPPQATSFDIEGDNAVSEIRFEKGKVYINKTQYFANVPELAWNFYIGGYQPAQKWLKGRFPTPERPAGHTDNCREGPASS